MCAACFFFCCSARKCWYNCDRRSVHGYFTSVRIVGIHINLIARQPSYCSRGHRYVRRHYIDGHSIRPSTHMEVLRFYQQIALINRLHSCFAEQSAMNLNDNVDSPNCNLIR
jgi:hypothetical protein